MLQKYDIKVGSIRYYWNYFKENFKISFKNQVEYKANLFSSLLENTIFFMITLLFGYVIFENIILIEGFGFYEFLLFAFLINIYGDLIGFFWHGTASSLDILIKRGDLNSYLTKPMNPFLGFLFMKRFNPLIFIIYDMILYVPILLYLFNFELLSIIYSLLLLFVLIIFGVIFIRFLDSFTWIFLEARKVLLYQLYFQGIQHNVGRFPMLFFDKNPAMMIFLGGFGFYYISMWILPLLLTGLFQVRLYEIIMILSVTSISIITIIINWKIGLKKYGAFS
ncbi:MAG: ABC-2 family transporter protein [Nanoarchaeota archaeon]|nr:ABC-2 family transporter protein [Nanoarchaeota archaeon]